MAAARVNRGLQAAEDLDWGRPGTARPFLMHAGCNAVTGIGLYAGRAAGEAAE